MSDGQEDGASEKFSEEINMVFDFYPWKIDVDVEETRCFYQENDYSSNKEWNKMFVEVLNASQIDFYHNLGIDLMKIEVEKVDFIDNEEVPFIYSIDFLTCGKFLSLPKQQLEVYADEDVFGKSVEIDLIECIETEDLVTYDGFGLGTGIRFKHPAVHFEEERFEKWDCGFIAGALIVRDR